MRILLVDDDDLGREILGAHLEDQLGHQVTQCSNAADALDRFAVENYPLVITDIKMPGIDGVDLLKRIKSSPRGRTVDVVLITAHGDMLSAISALRADAYDYLRKPIDLNELSAMVNRSVEHQRLIRDNYELTHRFEERLQEATRETNTRLKQLKHIYSEIAGVGEVGLFSNVMHSIVDLTRKLGEDTSMPVLVEGETGTGKEIVARLLHENSASREEPFVGINCSAISPSLFENELFGYEGGAFTGARKSGQIGKFELAQQGTIFLDEIADMPLEFQPKLLRVLQERNYYRVGGLKKIKLAARFICASNRNLEELIQEGKFRPDLFYRLNVGRIFVPPLRERRDEIVPLAEMFMRRYSSKMRRRFHSIDPEALEIIEKYAWPGNVRELQNTIERIVLLDDDTMIRPKHLKFLFTQNSGFSHSQGTAGSEADIVVIEMPEHDWDMAEAEAVIVRKAVEKFAGNKTRAAKYLKISVPTLRKRISLS